MESGKNHVSMDYTYMEEEDRDKSPGAVEDEQEGRGPA